MSRSRRVILRSFGAASIAAASGALLAQDRSAATPSEWLILYYMNGKNNLVKFALEDFSEMAKVGSSSAVSIVAQLGRPGTGNPPTHGGWSGVKRYLISKGMVPDEKSQTAHVGGAKDAAGDMGRPETLDAFITWAVERYPAKKRMLVIWNHGQGWRFQASGSANRFLAATRALSPAEAKPMAKAPVVGMFRSVSSDDDHRSILYNKQVQNILEAHAAKGTRFDIVAYDACLMSMVETAYSLRRCTDLLVGSQELEPGAGWEHTLFLRRLASTPAMSPEQLATAIVECYKERYGDNDMTTLSATRLKSFDSVAGAISTAAKAVRADAALSFPVLQGVRAQLKAFADYDGLGFAVDSESLFEKLASASQNPAVQSAALSAAKAIKSSVVSNYASSQCKDYSPRGLALYFPRTKADFMRDPDRAGYLRSNKKHPVDFVNDHEWSPLLKDLLRLPT